LAKRTHSAFAKISGYFRNISFHSESVAFFFLNRKGDLPLPGARTPLINPFSYRAPPETLKSLTFTHINHRQKAGFNFVSIWDEVKPGWMTDAG